MNSFPNTQGAMSDDEPEVEVVDDESQEVEVVDSPASPEEAWANARSPSPTPDTPPLDLPALIFRDEVFETRQEAAMLLVAAQEEEGAARSRPRYAAPGSWYPYPAAMASSYVKVRGESDLSPATLRNLERGRRTRGEATRRANRTRLLMDQENRAKESAEDRGRSRSNQRRKEQEEPEDAEKKRCKSASTWTPPKRRSLSPSPPVRCISPHNCRDSATGGCRHKLLDSTQRNRSTTPEARENPAASREIQDKYMRMMNMERERKREVWTRMEKEQKALLDTRDGMTKLMAKGTTELWRLKQRMECLLKGFENNKCDACGEENKSRAKREEEARKSDRSEGAGRWAPRCPAGTRST